MLTITKAALSHSKSIFALSTHPEIRAVSFQSKSFTFEEHSKWFQAVLQNSSVLFFVAIEKSKVLGYIRFVKDNSPQTIVSVTLSVAVLPGLGRRGIGRFLLQNGIEQLKVEWPGIQLVRAEVKVNNEISQRFFVACGFVENQSTKKDRKEFRYAL